MDTKKLRQKILDLAIHGKLVPQDPSDEPASVLLERIRAEKERLIAEGKIKRSKKSATSDTSHYEKVPEGWCITTIGEVFNLQAGKNISANDIHEFSQEFPYACYGGNGIRGYVSDYNKEGRFPIIGRQGALCGNVNFAEGKFYATEHAVVVTCIAGVNVEWARYVLEAMNLNQYATATAQPGLSVATVNEVEFLLPPLKEQCRIAEFVANCFDAIESLTSQTNNLRLNLERAKSKILDLAIHGKLMPQDPNDEPAIELLKRFNPKFVPCDNPHYGNVPDGWIMLKGKYLFDSMKSTKPAGEFFKYIDIDSVDNKRGIVTSPKVLSSNSAPSRAGRYTCQGDVLFSMVRPYLRNIAIVPENDCIASTGFFVCHPIPVMTAEFCYYLMKSSYIVDGLNQFMKGDNSPSINNKNITEWIYPIPPIDEQIRIVTKIQELYTTLDCITDALR